MSKSLCLEVHDKGGNVSLKKEGVQMTSRSSFLSVFAILTVAIVGLSLPVEVEAGHNSNPRIIPNVALPHGTSYGEWGAEWWKWALSTTLADSPLLDETGENCRVGQSGSVFFLAGTFGGMAERDCVVTTGQSLFFPIINGAFWSPEDCVDETSCRDIATMTIDLVDILEADIDGMPVENLTVYRAESSAFELNIAPGTIFTDFGFPPGVRFPTVADGYYLMLAPLSAGQHTIHFRGGISGEFETEVTYHLNVRGPRRRIPSFGE
jgi:hypothetical protein